MKLLFFLYLIAPNSCKASTRSASVTPSTSPRTCTTTDGRVLCGSSYPCVEENVSQFDLYGPISQIYTAYDTLDSDKGNLPQRNPLLGGNEEETSGTMSYEEYNNIKQGQSSLSCICMHTCNIICMIVANYHVLHWGGCVLYYILCVLIMLCIMHFEKDMHISSTTFFFITMDCEWKSFSDLLFCWSVSNVPAIQTNTIKYRKEQFSHIKWLRSPINPVTYSSLFIIMQTVKTTY